MPKIIIIGFLIIILSGCTTTRQALESARETISQLEQSNGERAARNIELEGLYTAERAGNKELERIINNQQSELNGYIEAERNRIEAEKLIVESLTGIFSEGSEIIEELIRGHYNIREIFEQAEEME
jgi:hypothetical protein